MLTIYKTILYFFLLFINHFRMGMTRFELLLFL